MKRKRKKSTHTRTFVVSAQGKANQDDLFIPARLAKIKRLLLLAITTICPEYFVTITFILCFLSFDHVVGAFNPDLGFVEITEYFLMCVICFTNDTLRKPKKNLPLGN